MTNIEKLIKAITFITDNGLGNCIARQFIIEDGVPYRVESYFYDYHSGRTEIEEKQEVTEEQAKTYLEWASIADTVDTLLLQFEEKNRKQSRLNAFYTA